MDNSLKYIVTYENYDFYLFYHAENISFWWANLRYSFYIYLNLKKVTINKIQKYLA